MAAIALAVMIVMGTPVPVILGVLVIGWLLVHYFRHQPARGLFAVGGAAFFALVIQIPGLGPVVNRTVNESTSFGGPMAEKLHLPSVSFNVSGSTPSTVPQTVSAPTGPIPPYPVPPGPVPAAAPVAGQ